MRRLLSCLLAFLVATTAAGQDVPLEIVGGDAKPVKVEKYVVTYVEALLVTKLPFEVKAPSTGFDYEWSFPETVKAKAKRNVLTILAAPSGELVVSAAWVNILVKDGQIEPVPQTGSKTFYVGEIKPPVPPAPPVPPDPAPSPAPIPLPGLRALIIYETNAGPPDINLIVSGEKVRSYMAEKGVKGGFLALDKDSTDDDLSRTEPWAKDAFKRPREAYKRPWIVISNGVTGYEGPLPLTNAPNDALALIRKVGG